MSEPSGGRPPFYDRLDEQILAAYSVPPALYDRTEPIKLTAWQKAYLLAMYPQQGHHYRFASELGHFAGRPIELVERWEDSDVPQLRPAIQGFHPDVVIVDEELNEPHRGWLGRLLDRLFGGQS